ncbi:MAG TPA: hypothetical protein VMZ28_00525, partial [Kofleriaceae bacterium]|nr:hypothetical protein [Kofleriaceae bacterium]
ALLSAAAALLSASAACNIIDSNGIHVDYAFDPQEFKQSIGDEKVPQTLPTVACTPGATPDPCVPVMAMIPPNSGTVACDGAKQQCAATFEISLPQTIDLRMAMTPLPSEAVQFGINNAEIRRIAYWVSTNTLTVATPALDIYVAPETAKDEKDPKAVKLGSVASLPAKSRACADPQNNDDPMAKMGQMVCDIPLTVDGQKALADHVKAFKTAPFKIIARATIKADGGTAVPAGTIDFFVRPTVRLSILK